MAIDAGLRTLLLAQSSITTLAAAQVIPSGGVSYPAVFCDYAVQNFTGSHLVITAIGKDPLGAMDGTTGLEVSDIDIDCYAKTNPAAKALAKAVTDYLKDYTGAAGASDTIKAMHWEDEAAHKVDPADGSDVRWCVVTLSFRIFHQAA